MISLARALVAIRIERRNLLRVASSSNNLALVVCELDVGISEGLADCETLAGIQYGKPL